MLDKVRQTIIISLFIMHVIVLVLALGVVFGVYDAPSLTTIQSMFSTTFTGIGAGLLTLVGDRGMKNWSAPNQENKDKTEDKVK